MADSGSSDQQGGGEGEKFQPPDKKTLEELRQLEETDESLKKYKENLLGNPDVLAFPDDPRTLIVKSLTILVDGREDICLDLSGDSSRLKDTPVVLKEGCKHRVRIVYYVQREIVFGLKYIMTGYHHDNQVWREEVMLGSYAPRPEEHIWTSAEEEAPSGTGARGIYLLRDCLRDDDGAEHFHWEWALQIKPEWD